MRKPESRDISVAQKNMGYFLADENEWWNVIWNAGFRRMVSQLKPADLERFKQEHLKEVSTFKTKDRSMAGYRRAIYNRIDIEAPAQSRETWNLPAPAGGGKRCNSREVALLQGASGSCRRGLH